MPLWRMAKVPTAKDAACLRAAIAHKAQLGIWEAGDKTLPRQDRAGGETERPESAQNMQRVGDNLTE